MCVVCNHQKPVDDEFRTSYLCGLLFGLWAILDDAFEKMVEQYRCDVPQADRRDGWLYDANSGVLLGLASYELRMRYAVNVPFNFVIAGCPHVVVIHKAKP